MREPDPPLTGGVGQREKSDLLGGLGFRGSVRGFGFG